MKSDNNSKHTDSVAHTPEPDNIYVSEMLTPPEIEQLKREKKEHNA